MRHILEKRLTANNVLLEFKDGPVSLSLSPGATFADVSENLDILAKWHSGPPLSVDVSFHPPRTTISSPPLKCLISSTIYRSASGTKRKTLNQRDYHAGADTIDLFLQPEKNIAIAALPKGVLAKQAVNALTDAGVSFSDITVAGQTSLPRDNVAPLYNHGTQIKLSGRRKPFWEKLWSRFEDGLVFTIPSASPVVVVGFLAPAMILASEEIKLTGGLSSFFAALWPYPIPMLAILQCILDLKTDKFLVMVQGDAASIERARSIIDFINLPHLEWLAPQHAQTILTAQNHNGHWQFDHLQ